ncbi:MAG: TonB-dependent receptor [Gemmatimonadota bacterium]|nr:TonB-dependent receptor [Gemmatimonadota bacterium]
MQIHLKVLRYALIFTLLGGACAFQASAEEGDDVEEVDEAEKAVDEELIVYELDAITVTGSRIKSEDLVTPAPVIVMSRDEIKVRGLASIGDVLQTLTVQSNAINTQANNGGDGSTRISLRGLGAHRTLVLLNGRRFVPGGTGANSSVDLNAIPASAVERVEVLKDGASAVYGSDAVGGVVNVITRAETEGLEFEIYRGVAGEGDGETLDISVTAGLKSEKGSVLFSAGYHNQAPVWTGDRPFSTEDKTYDWEKNDGTYATSGSSATPEGHIIDRTGDPGNEAWQTVNAAAGEDAGDYHLDPNAGWRPFNWAGNSSDGSGDLYNYQPENYLYTPQTRYTSFLSGTYEFAPEAEGFFEVSYTNRQSDQKLAPTPLFIISEGLSISSTNIHNEFGREFYDVRRRFVEAGNRNFIQDINTYRIVLGMEYPLLDFESDVSFTYGRSEGTNINEGRFVRSRLAHALGPAEECAALGDCVPLDLLHGAGTITQEMLDYIQYTGIATGYSKQKILQLNLTGQLAELPAGPLGVAAGVSSRWEAGAYLPDPVTRSGNTTGSKQEATEGAYSVRALYGEASVPVLRADAASLDLSAAGRAFDYDTFGSGFTYEAGTRCELPRGLTLRATISNAFRAPGIAEMFLGQSDAFPLVSDPCSVVDEAGSARTLTAEQQRNCAAAGVPPDFKDSRAQLRAKVGGSTELDPETAAMITAGLVYQPEYAENLDIAISYYTNKIEDVIGSLPAGLILSNCYSQVTPSYCDQIVRDPNTKLITTIFSQGANVGETETSGLDIELDYSVDTPLGFLTARTESNLLFKYEQLVPAPGGLELVKGRGYYDLGVFPRWRHALTAGLSQPRISFGLNLKYVGGFLECEDDDCKGLYRDDVSVTPVSRKVSSNSTIGLYGSYRLGTRAGASVLTVGINNVFNQRPAVIFNGFLGTSDSSTYDFMGRYMYARLSHFL